MKTDTVIRHCSICGHERPFLVTDVYVPGESCCLVCEEDAEMADRLHKALLMRAWGGLYREDYEDLMALSKARHM